MRLPIALLVVLAAASCSSHSSPKATVQQTGQATSTTAAQLSPAQVSANSAASKNVTITACAPDNLQNVDVQGRAHNPTGWRVSYTIQVEIRDPSRKGVVATVASLNKVEPNTTARWDAATTARYTAGTTCTITSVTQRPS